jgi:hypothetical protein
MKFSSTSLLGCMAVLALACASVRAAPPPPPPTNVTVHYTDPKLFTETKRSAFAHPIDANGYLNPLKDYIAQRASRILAPGQRLDIKVTDVDLAGEYEPWHGPNLSNIRIIKNRYPPRIDLDFTLYGADGKILRQGHRSLRDMSFLDHAGISDNDSLRYEKPMIDRWLRQGPDKL